jgi:ABC-type glycerol-3-phosphate transport system substrate-binding protein
LRVFRSKNKWAAAMFGVAVIATIVAAVAFASAGSGTTSTIFVTAADFQKAVEMNSDRVKFQTKDATDVRVQKLDFAAGGYSGWHHHPGIIISAVQSGAVTLMESDCSSTTYGPGLPDGAVFVEGGDAPVQASSTNGATLYITYVAPDANPPVFRIEDDPPPCAAP